MHFEKAEELLREFKQDRYIYGENVLKQIGNAVKKHGKKVLMVRSKFSEIEPYVKEILENLNDAGIKEVQQEPGPAPNAPLEDLYRITERVREVKPDFLISFGGGSTIDITKAADVLYSLGGDIEDYFGTDQVTEKIKSSGKKLIQHIAIQTAASSAAHLTKYSNITNLKTGQKKLIVDKAIVPDLSMFDYRLTYSAPRELTMDGAMDGFSHSLEVLYSAAGKDYYKKVEEIAETSISLIIMYLPGVLKNPDDREGRKALCLGTDLGGYAIMVGGTNGGHLTSFSLVDILSHGRACAILNPYYTVFFAPAIEEPLKMVGRIFREEEYIKEGIENLRGRNLGIKVAEGMIEFAKTIGFPTRLKDVKGFTDEHIEKALKAAKNPQLRMKLQNMPVPFTEEMIDEYMRPILEAARDGNLTIIKNAE